jgi:hypothetical protein
MQIAAMQVGASTTAAKKDQLEQTNQKLEGARMGVDIAKHRAQMAVQQAQRASQNKPKRN